MPYKPFQFKIRKWIYFWSYPYLFLTPLLNLDTNTKFCHTYTLYWFDIYSCSKWHHLDSVLAFTNLIFSQHLFQMFKNTIVVFQNFLYFQWKIIFILIFTKSSNNFCACTWLLNSCGFLLKINFVKFPYFDILTTINTDLLYICF